MKQQTPSYWRLVDPYWDKICIYDEPERFLAELRAAPEVVQTLFVTHWLQSEVSNGGFGQFFDNSTGVLAPEAVSGFLAIGMPKASEFVDGLIKAFGGTYPRKREDRQDALSLIYETASGDDASNLLLTYSDEEFFVLLKLENGGFLASANRYADRVL